MSTSSEVSSQVKAGYILAPENANSGRILGIQSPAPRVIKPIPFRLQRNDVDWIAATKLGGIVGYGSSVDKAVNSLATSLVARLREYSYTNYLHCGEGERRRTIWIRAHLSRS